MLERIIRKGVSEGTMDPNIDPAAAARAALYLFSYIIENSVRLPGDKKKERMVIGEIKKMFEIILKGIARPGIGPALLVLPDPPEGTGSGDRKPGQTRQAAKT
jgi:hypothetical protein